ncbi:hypothetical protein JOB18_002984 [Solea senegalensis]|nr:hypothetical protein JOB18_002984 [Solea senegalensis]
MGGAISPCEPSERTPIGLFAGLLMDSDSEPVEASQEGRSIGLQRTSDIISFCSVTQIRK